MAAKRIVNKSGSVYRLRKKIKPNPITGKVKGRWSKKKSGTEKPMTEWERYLQRISLREMWKKR